MEQLSDERCKELCHDHCRLGKTGYTSRGVFSRDISHSVTQNA